MYSQFMMHGQKSIKLNVLVLYCSVIKFPEDGSPVPKHVEESNILRINNSQCMKLVINV